MKAKRRHAVASLSLLLVLGVIGMSVYLRQRQATQSKPQALSDEDRRKVQEILKSGDAP